MTSDTRSSKPLAMWSDTELCAHLRTLGEPACAAADYIERLKSAYALASNQAMENGALARSLAETNALKDYACSPYECYGVNRAKLIGLRCTALEPPTTQAHIANEWADMASNGIQWLRNVQDGTSTCEEALAEMVSNAARIRALRAQPPSAAHDINALLEVAREVSSMDCFHTGEGCPADCKCIVALASKAIVAKAPETKPAATFEPEQHMTTLPPCVWRDGCRAPEVCGEKGHCDAPVLEQRKAYERGGET